MNRFKISIKRGLTYLFALSLSSVFLSSCSNNSSSSSLVGNWVKSSDFEGSARKQAVCFVIGDNAYVGTGYNGKKIKDFYKFDSETKAWTQIAEFKGAARYSAVAFTAGNKGYVGTGYDGNNYLNDFWVYDPSANSWDTLKTVGTDSPTAREGAVAFGIGNKGYVSCGYDDSYLKDFWEYNAETNQWTKKPSSISSKRRYASAFVLEGKGYIVTGIGSDGLPVTDFWRYDPSASEADAWKELRPIANKNTDETYDDKYTSIARMMGVVMPSENDKKAYLATGASSGTSLSSNVWEYDAVNDTWTEKTKFPSPAREGAVGFSIKGRFFVTTGTSGVSYLEDTREFKPNDEDNTNDD